MERLAAAGIDYYMLNTAYSHASLLTLAKNTVEYKIGYASPLSLAGNTAVDFGATSVTINMAQSLVDFSQHKTTNAVSYSKTYSTGSDEDGYEFTFTVSEKDKTIINVARSVDISALFGGAEWDDADKASKILGADASYAAAVLGGVTYSEAALTEEVSAVTQDYFVDISTQVFSNQFTFAAQYLSDVLSRLKRDSVWTQEHSDFVIGNDRHAAQKQLAGGQAVVEITDHLINAAGFVSPYQSFKADLASYAHAVNWRISSRTGLDDIDTKSVQFIAKQPGEPDEDLNDDDIDLLDKTNIELGYPDPDLYLLKLNPLGNRFLGEFTDQMKIVIHVENTNLGDKIYTDTGKELSVVRNGDTYQVEATKDDFEPLIDDEDFNLVLRFSQPDLEIVRVSRYREVNSRPFYKLLSTNNGLIEFTAQYGHYAEDGGSGAQHNVVEIDVDPVAVVTSGKILLKLNLADNIDQLGVQSITLQHLGGTNSQTVTQGDWLDDNGAKMALVDVTELVKGSAVENGKLLLQVLPIGIAGANHDGRLNTQILQPDAPGQIIYAQADQKIDFTGTHYDDRIDYTYNFEKFDKVIDGSEPANAGDADNDIIRLSSDFAFAIDRLSINLSSINGADTQAAITAALDPQYNNIAAEGTLSLRNFETYDLRALTGVTFDVTQSVVSENATNTSWLFEDAIVNMNLAHGSNDRISVKFNQPEAEKQIHKVFAGFADETTDEDFDSLYIDASQSDGTARKLSVLIGDIQSDFQPVDTDTQYIDSDHIIQTTINNITGSLSQNDHFVFDYLGDHDEADAVTVFATAGSDIYDYRASDTGTFVALYGQMPYLDSASKIENLRVRFDPVDEGLLTVTKYGRSGQDLGQDTYYFGKDAAAPNVMVQSSAGVRAQFELRAGQSDYIYGVNDTYNLYDPDQYFYGNNGGLYKYDPVANTIAESDTNQDDIAFDFAYLQTNAGSDEQVISLNKFAGIETIIGDNNDAQVITYDGFYDQDSLNLGKGTLSLSLATASNDVDGVTEKSLRYSLLGSKVFLEDDGTETSWSKLWNLVDVTAFDFSQSLVAAVINFETSDLLTDHDYLDQFMGAHIRATDLNDRAFLNVFGEIELDMGGGARDVVEYGSGIRAIYADWTSDGLSVQRYIDDGGSTFAHHIKNAEVLVGTIHDDRVDIFGVDDFEYHALGGQDVITVQNSSGSLVLRQDKAQQSQSTAAGDADGFVLNLRQTTDPSLGVQELRIYGFDKNRDTIYVDEQNQGGLAFDPSGIAELVLEDDLVLRIYDHYDLA